MADRETTPAATAAEVGSSPMTPAAKRIRTTSPPKSVVTEVSSKAEGTTTTPPKSEEVQDSAAVAAEQSDDASDDDDIEADDDLQSSSGYGTDNSDTTSISSSIYQGYVENGRRYQTKREGEYWGPSDEKQFESMEASHILHMVLDSRRKNNLFYSPIPQTAQNILDIGTGSGRWPIEVADRYPSALVQGIDLFPPPEHWLPPNCRLEVDDVLKPWQFQDNGRFDFIHLRYMFGAFTDEQWRLLYKQAYKNLAPGGWIEQLEPSVYILCDDDTLPKDSLVGGWGPMFIRCCAKTGKNIDTVDTMKSSISAAGFTNVHEKSYKVPFGQWTKDPLLKEAGRFQKMQVLSGMEGYALFLLTHFGEPHPWSVDEVQVYLSKVRNELNNPAFHIYVPMRRVWAQKPFDSKPKVESKVEVQNFS